MFLSNETSFFFTIVGLGFVIRICEDGVTGDEMVLQQRLEILLTRGAEQECIDFSRQFCECLVCGCKESTANLGGRRIECVDQTRLDERQVQCAENRRDKLNNSFGGEGGNEEFVDSVDYAVGGVLYTLSAWLFP